MYLHSYLIALHIVAALYYNIQTLHCYLLFRDIIILVWRNMNIFGIELAPLFVPLKRRWETFAVFFWMGTFIFSTILLGPVIILIYTICFTEYSWLGLAYIVWILIDFRTCDRQIYIIKKIFHKINILKRRTDQMRNKICQKLENLETFLRFLPSEADKDFRSGQKWKLYKYFIFLKYNS